MTAERPTSGLELDLGLLKRGGLLLLLLLAFAVRLPGLTAQSLWRDEVDALRFSQEPLGTMLRNFSRAGWNGPLYYLVLRVWVSMTGQSEFALRYLSLLFGVLSVALLYRLGRDWFSPLVGTIAALLMATSPYMVWYAQETKMYSLLSPLVIGILYLYRRALEYRDWRLWAAVIVGVWVLVGLHVMGGLLVPVLFVLLVFWWPLIRRSGEPVATKAQPPVAAGKRQLFPDRVRQLVAGRARLPVAAGVRQAALGLFLCVLPFLAGMPWVWRRLWRGVNIGHDFVPLPNMVTAMLYAFGRGITSTGGLWPVGLVIFFSLAGLLLWPDRDQLIESVWTALAGQRREIGAPAYVAVLCAWLLVPLLGLLLISTRVPMFVDRYLIWIGPALFMLMARGYDRLRRRMDVLASLCLVVLLLFNGWAVLWQTTTPIKSDFRAAAAYMREVRRPGEPILFHLSYVRDTFEYYFGPVTPALEGVPTNEQTTREAVDQAMRAELTRASGERYDVVWLVLSEPEMWDERGMTVNWLETNARADLRVDFERVSIARYRFD